MDKGLLLRMIERIGEAGLKTQASAIIEPKIPKTVFIALLTHIGYPMLKRNLPKARVDDVFPYFFYDGPYTVYLTAEDAINKTLHEVNWGYAPRPRPADALLVLEVKREALEFQYGTEWKVRRQGPNKTMVVSGQMVPVDRSEHDMYYIDHDMIEDAE